MAEPLTIPIIRLPDYLATDRLQLEVAAATQPDRILPAVPGRHLQGYGFGLPGETGYGFGRGLPYGGGAYGGGYYGQGAERFGHATVASFVAGDYSCRLRSIDSLGNDSAWSGLFTIAHRPIPPAPTGLTLSESTIAWTWSDP